MTQPPPPRTTQASPPATRPHGLAGRLAAAAARVLRLLLVSLLVSIVIEWVGMHLWWSEAGSDHSRQMVEAEARFLDANIAATWTHSAAAIAVGGALTRLGNAVARSEILAPVSRWWRRAHAHATSSPYWLKLQRFANPYVRAAGNVVKLYGIRLTVLCMAAPLFLLLILVGLVDGLVRRDLRRWGGGRESSYVYHYAKRSNLFLLGLGAIVYLAIPVTLHPSLVLVPFAVACAITVSVTASRFKKYL